MVASEEAVAQALLSSLKIERYEPGVISVVLEQMHRAAQALLTDGRDAALHAGRDAITVQDLQLVDDLAAEDDYSASPLPSREAMFQVARLTNAQPIKLDDGHGLRLPPKEYRLTNNNFQLVPRGPPRPAAPAPSSPPKATPI